VPDLLNKINHRDQTIALVNVPPEISADIDALLAGAEITTTLPESVDFALVFVRTLDEVRRHGTAVLSRARGDAVVWFCYPKQTSKRYTCEFNRDTGWQVLADHRFEPVRQVALDEDWSALRFRNLDYIKKLTRKTGLAG
jgi:hypothetical protein